MNVYVIHNALDFEEPKLYLVLFPVYWPFDQAKEVVSARHVLTRIKKSWFIDLLMKNKIFNPNNVLISDMASMSSFLLRHDK